MAPRKRSRKAKAALTKPEHLMLASFCKLAEGYGFHVRLGSSPNLANPIPYPLSSGKLFSLQVVIFIICRKRQCSQPWNNMGLN